MFGVGLKTNYKYEARPFLNLELFITFSTVATTPLCTINEFSKQLSIDC